MFPIYKVIDYDLNRYLLSKAVMKRARQINFVGDENLDKFSGKIVSLALKQVFGEEIKYLNPQDDPTIES
jgi:DNA-directed RNA polymerase subunit K/omega